MEALQDGVYYVNLYETECYDEVEYTNAMNKTLSQWKKIEEFQASEITYLFDEKKEEIGRAHV